MTSWRTTKIQRLMKMRICLIGIPAMRMIWIAMPYQTGTLTWSLEWPSSKFNGSPSRTRPTRHSCSPIANSIRKCAVPASGQMAKPGKSSSHSATCRTFEDAAGCAIDHLLCASASLCTTRTSRSWKTRLAASSTIIIASGPKMTNMALQRTISAWWSSAMDMTGYLIVLSSMLVTRVSWTRRC